LYHFCAAHDLRSILANGLTEGGTPIWENGKMRVVWNTQWLTADKDPARQSWNTRHILPYSRTAYRLTIMIPFNRRKKLIPAIEFISRFPEENASLVTDWPGSENWFVFLGTIPPTWIVGHKKMADDTPRIDYTAKRPPSNGKERT